jgi:hypothetical protein
MCKCVAKVNKLLAPNNTVLDQTSLINFTTGQVRESLVVATRRLNPRNKRSKVKTIIPSFCPFCGGKIERRYKDATHDQRVPPKEIRQAVARATKLQKARELSVTEG